MSSSWKIKRREFLSKLLIWTGVGIIFNAFPSILKNCLAVNRKQGRIVTVYHSRATDGTGKKDNVNLDDEVVKKMVDEGIKSFTGKDDLKEAWGLIIPDASKKVAIKINCQIEGIYTKSKVVNPIVSGLILRGVSPDNIIIYDKTDKAFRYAGFIKSNGPGVKIRTVKDFGGYNRFLFDRLARLLTGGFFLTENKYYCDYLINVPVLKALDGYSGVTLSMKNHFGSIANPHDHHDDIMNYLPELNSSPYIREKTRLIVLDAIFVEYKWINGRDQKYIDILNKIMISDDPVAVDQTGWEIIDQKRKEHGLGPVSPKPVYIQQAADMGLGTNNPNQININLGGQH